MYKIIKDVINSKDYKLENILHKINKMYIEDRISEEEKTDLDNLAREKARPENSFDIQKQLEDIFNRLEVLENRNTTTQEPSETIEEYPEFKQPTGAHDTYKAGDKITYNGKKYTCILENCVWSPDTYPAGWEEVIEENNETVQIVEE